MRKSSCPQDGTEGSDTPVFIALKEEHRLGVFENRVPRRIFGSKNEEIGDWGKLHYEELYNQ
jgi:hypothetical protein